jgi:acyl-CoA thioesterase-1
MVSQSLQVALHKLPKLREITRNSLFLLTLFCISALAQAQTQTQPKILVMGDSLSAAYGIDPQLGWVALLQEKLDQTGNDYQIVNASISGETSGGGLKRLPKLLASHNPDIVLIELGANDGLRGYPLKRMKQNLKQMIQLSQQNGAQIVLAEMMIPPNYGPLYSLKFKSVYENLEDDYELQLLPFLLDGVAGNSKLIQRDGLHPTAEAQPIILENVWPFLKKVL